MLPMGIGTALAIRLGSTLPRNVARAKQLAFWSIVIAVVLFGLISVFAYTFRHAIFDLFTHDPQVLELAEAIWLKVSVYCFFLCIFGVFSGLAVGLGMQWSLGLVCTFFLWIVALPGLYLHSVTYDGGFVTAWNWIYPPYLFMNIVLLYQFLTSSWDDISREIRVREGIEDMPLIGSDGTVVAKEDTPLLLQV
jgi:Na+-driven multidrug efflux pump